MKACLIPNYASPPNKTKWSTDFHIPRELERDDQFSEPGRKIYDLKNERLAKNLEKVSTPPDDIRLRRELASILEDCKLANWDGYDALPLNMASVYNVTEFISLIAKSNLIYPELVPEPNGDLAMSWGKKDYRIAVSVDENGIIHYGSSTPSGRVFGSAKLRSKPSSSAFIPEELVELIELITREG